MDTDALLQVKDLYTWFELRRWGFARVGHVRAVDGVSFELYPGETVAVVGESGSGKSTLAKTILGLYRPTRGEIYFAGKPVHQMKAAGLKEYRAKVGYVQQDPFGALPPFMNVRRILEEPLIVHGVRDRAEREQRIHRALEDVKLVPVEDYLSKFPHQLSGGQQQRLVIARAILLEPRMIVADEPVSMLDVSVRVEILELLRKIQQEYNLGIIYITHDLSTVRHFSHRILVMYGGKVVERARARDLVRNPQHPYTQALLAALSDPRAENAHTLKPVPPGEPPSLLNPPPGCRFHPRCPVRIEGLCEREAPPEVETPQGAGHKALCWLYHERGEKKEEVAM